MGQGPGRRSTPGCWDSDTVRGSRDAPPSRATTLNSTHRTDNHIQSALGSRKQGSQFTCYLLGSEPSREFTTQTDEVWLAWACHSHMQSPSMFSSHSPYSGRHLTTLLGTIVCQDIRVTGEAMTLPHRVQNPLGGSAGRKSVDPTRLSI